MDNLTNVSLNAELSFSEESFEDDRYIKTRLKVMHEGLNLNNSNFNASVISKAKNTLKNIFIVANVIQDENGVFDFGAHDFEVEENKFTGEGYKVAYKELPIGFIPETNNYEFKRDEDTGKNYVYVDGYIVRDYSNYAEDIVKRYIKENKPIKISMEIRVKDYSLETAEDIIYYDILDYKYLVITLLGEKYEPGMMGAKAEFNLEENQKKKIEFIKKIQNLQQLFSNITLEKKEGEVMKDNLKDGKNLEQETETEINNGETEEDTAKEEFSLTANKIFNILRRAFPDEEKKDEDDKVIEYNCYWVMDYDEKCVYVNKWSNETDIYFKVDYAINEETQEATINWDTMEEINRIYATKEEQKLIEENREKEMNALREKNSTFSEEISNLEETISNKDIELKELQDFKLGVEKEAKKLAKEEHDEEISKVLEDFAKELNCLENENNSESSKYKEIKEQAYEMEIEDLEKELYALVGKLKYGKRKVKSKTKKFNKSLLGVPEQKENAEDEKIQEYFKKYGSMAKYIKIK